MSHSHPTNSIVNFTINHTPQFSYINPALHHHKHKKQVIELEDDQAIPQCKNKIQIKQFFNQLQTIVKKTLSNELIDELLEQVLAQAKNLPLKVLWNIEYTNRLSYVSHLMSKKCRQTNLNSQSNSFGYKQKQKIIQKLQTQIQRLQKLYVTSFQNTQFLHQMQNQVNQIDSILSSQSTTKTNTKNSTLDISMSNMENINGYYTNMKNMNIANMNSSIIGNMSLAASMYLNMGNMQMATSINPNNNFFANNYMKSMYMNNSNDQFMNNMMNQQQLSFDAIYPKNGQMYSVMLGNQNSLNGTTKINNQNNYSNAAQNGHKKH